MTTLLQLLAAFAGGAAAMWLLMRDRRLTERIAELERQANEPPAPSKWAENLRLDHRAQLASIATLAELALGDLLDATIRLNPEAAHRAIEKHAPHLFRKDNIE